MAGGRRGPQWYGCPTRGGRDGDHPVASVCRGTGDRAVRCGPYGSMGRTARRADPKWSYRRRGSRPRRWPRAGHRVLPGRASAARRRRHRARGRGIPRVGGLFLAWVAFATPVVTGLTPDAVRPTLVQHGDRRRDLGDRPRRAAVLRDRRRAAARPGRPGPHGQARRARRQPGRPRRSATTTSRLRTSGCPTAASSATSCRAVRVRGHQRAAAAARDAPHRQSAGRSAGADGRWSPYENPLERTGARRRARPALVRRRRARLRREGLRRRRDDRPDGRRGRPPARSSTPDQIPAWLASLPPSRALTADRRADVIEQVRGAHLGRRGQRARGATIGGGRGARTRTWNQRDISPPL